MNTQPANFNGVFCINKPAGFTSFDVVAKLRGILHQKQLGHGGTLDPMATGVLPVFAGAATKALTFLPCRDKRYLASVRFGVTSDTLDVTGKLERTAPPTFSLAQLAQVLQGFVGKSMQLPPMYSAVSVNGTRLYKLARAGQVVERTPRPIEIFALTLVDFDPVAYEAKIDVSCSAGTYIRSLADDIGQRLHTGCILTALERESALGYTLADCVTLEQLESAAKADCLPAYLRPVAPAFADLPGLVLNDRLADAFTKGQPIDPAYLDETVKAPLQAAEFFPVWKKTQTGLTPPSQQMRPGLQEPQEQNGQLKRLLGMGFFAPDGLRPRRVFQATLR